MKPELRDKILNGSLWHLLLTLSMPGIIGMSMVALNSLLDSFFISSYLNMDAFEGVTSAMPLLTIQSSIIAMIASGASILYSRAIGKEDRDTLDILFMQVMVLCVFAFLLILFIFIIMGRWVFDVLLHVPASAMEYGMAYYRVNSMGSLPVIIGLCTSALIRAEGNIKYAMRITGLSTIANVVLHYVFLGILHSGIIGSALASVLSMSVYACFNISYFARGKGFLKFSIKLPSSLLLAHSIITTGLSTFFIQFNGVLRQLFLFAIVIRLSSEAAQTQFFMAAYRMFSFIAIPLFGILQSFGPVVGMNIGAGNIDRTYQSLKVFRIGMEIFLFLLVLPVMIFPHIFLGLIYKGYINVMGIQYFRVLLLVLFFLPLSSSSVVFLQTTGNKKKAAWLTFGREWLLFFPLLLILSRAFSLQGIYYGLFWENILYALIAWTVCKTSKRSV